MNVIKYIGLIIGIIGLIIYYFLYKKNKQVSIKRNLQQEQYNRKILKENISLLKEKSQLSKSLQDKKKKIQQEINNTKTKYQKELSQYIQDSQEKADKTVTYIYEKTQKEIDKLQQDLCLKKKEKLKEKQQLQKNINDLKASLKAGIDAQMRAKQQEQEIKFYKLSVQDNDLNDIEKLNQLKKELHKPVILSKLIWTQYFQKQTSELCDRILGKKQITGIYKITNLKTKQCYIGQSVNIAERWKQHCKCGLGIDASATNLLYNAMQEYGIWNFTFELMEECPREKLNEKERFWIEMYQSNKVGYNMMKGNS